MALMGTIPKEMRLDEGMMDPWKPEIPQCIKIPRCHKQHLSGIIAYFIITFALSVQF